ncbi:hypothetical protein [Paenibacillus sp. J5C2022]|uniref:hypothetical protein n=1 Tax=Paenibacillus sp. J5C2022 TaxID=2977129 RepID=UPI0021D182DE|nr:hypothetical protein [Paenibacillus sp. J5C2022]
MGDLRKEEMRMNEEKLPLSSTPADRDRDPMHEMQLGKNLYIVKCHIIGNETLGDKIERLVLRTWEEEAFRSR